MWMAYIQEFSELTTFSVPNSAIEIKQLESKLGTILPLDLYNLLLETNGVFFNYGVALIKPIQDLVKTNAVFRQGRLSSHDFRNLLLFSEHGNGDEYGFVIENDEIAPYKIVCWNHEEDSLEAVPAPLKAFLEYRLMMYQK
jgi:hypothetical protein